MRVTAQVRYLFVQDSVVLLVAGGTAGRHLHCLCLAVQACKVASQYLLARSHLCEAAKTDLAADQALAEVPTVAAELEA